MDNLKIHFLNTIWSDAILLESYNHFGFVDTGSKFYYPMIEKHLNEYNITELDFIILTHFHNDHYGNIVNIFNNFKVHKLYLKHYYGLDGTTSSGYESNEEYIKNEFNNYNNILDKAKNNNVEIIFIDDFNNDTYIINFNNINIELYHTNNLLYELYKNPNSNYYNKKMFNENFNSIGVFIKHLNHSIFLGADVTCSSTDIVELKELSIKMINKIYNKHNINKINLYKSCHHGGSGTNTLPLCKLINPDYVIITNTNRWLDNYSTIENLLTSNSSVNILKTDYSKYIFNIFDSITYSEIKEESLFITLKKD